MCDTFTESWNMLFNHHIKPHTTLLPEWQKFRNRLLWTLDVNDVLEVNLDEIKKVH